MARDGGRATNSHASETAVAASLASLASCYSDGSGSGPGSSDTTGANRRPAINGHTLRENFHLPLHTVALKFGMCTTAFKKMCRRLGIAKWPHRQLRGIDKKIAALKAELTYASSSDRHQFISGLNSLEEEKSRLAMCLLGEGESFSLGTTAGDDGEDDDESRGTPPPTPPNTSIDARLKSPEDHESDAEEESLDEEDHHRDGSDAAGRGEFANATSGAGVSISEKELRLNFHLPLHTAARKFGICTTAFKKLCRRFGIAKWPHRQLRGIDKKIAALKAELNYTTGDRHGCWKSLHALEDEKKRLSCSGAVDASGSPNKRRRASDDEEEVPSKGHRARSTTSSYAADASSDVEEDDDEEVAKPEAQQEQGMKHSGSLSALDLLAAVAGVKEEHDREEEIKRQAQPQATSPCSSTDQEMPTGHFDTPPMNPVSPKLSLHLLSGKPCMSPFNQPGCKESSMAPASSTPLIGFSWNGNEKSIDQCA